MSDDVGYEIMGAYSVAVSVCMILLLKTFVHKLCVS